MFPTLFSPIELAGQRLRNRIGFAAMSTRFPAGGRSTDQLVTHLAARAAGGAAVVVTEALCAAPSATLPVRIHAYDDAALPGLAKIAAAVAKHGAIAIGQLWHGGSAHHGPRGLDSVGASPVADGMSWTVPRTLSSEEVGDLVQDYAASAHRLQRAGFGGAEVSAAHGFLPLQFLSPVTNRREDAWGGDVQGRSRFVREIIRAIRDRCGPGFIIGLKLPADDFVPNSIDVAESARLTAAITADAPPDWLCFSQGSHGWSLHRHAPDMHDPVAPYREMWRALRQAAAGVAVAAIGRIGGPAMAEEVLAAGDADLVMMARPLLADPFWPAKTQAGRVQDITPCIHCNACWGEIHRNVQVGCAVNPHVGSPRDGAPEVPRALRAKRVVVVGAGVAGLKAATAAAERGHAVTLLGRGAGGAAALQSRLPGAADIARAVAQFTRRAEAAGVEMRLGAEADVAAVLALKPDAVVLATGAAMAPPPRFIDTDGTARDARSACAALLADPRAGGDLAVLLDMDATPATYDAAELLAARFRRLVLATPREVIARDSPVIVAQGIHRRLAALGVEIRVYREAASLADGTLTLRNILTGAEETLAGVSLFAYSTARVPRDALAAPLRAAGLHPRAVGDALAPRLMLSAVREGQAAGEAV
jgi:2,4-dienoyl-CoA reductase-like NADH-dependent reductase (Old Yellow Enzyme family)